MFAVSFLVVFILPFCISFTSSNFQNEGKADQQILVVSVIDFPPYFIIERDNGTNEILSRRGLAIDILSWLAEQSNVQISYLDLVDRKEYEKYGLMPLLIKNLLSKDSDIVPLMTIILNEIQNVDYAFPISLTNYRFMIPYPEEEQMHQLTAIFHPIDTMVWLMLIIAMIGLVVFMSLYNRCYWHRNSFELTATSVITRRILYVFGLFTGRSSAGNFFVVPYKSFLSIRCIIGLLALMSVILFSGYTTTLTSFLTVQKLKPIVNSFQELASSKQYQLVQPLQLSTGTIFLNATTEPFKTLGKSLRQNPNLLITDFPDSLAQKLLDYNGVYAHVEQEIHSRIGLDMKAHKGQCRFTASKPLDMSMAYYTVLRKGDPIVKTINLGTIRMFEYGLLKHWVSTYAPNIDKCIIKEKQTLYDELRRWRPLTLKQLSGNFLLLFFGVVFAIIIFFIELLWNKLIC